MACLVEPLEPEQCSPRTPGQVQAYDYITELFKRKPASVRSLGEHSEGLDVCIVKWSGFAGANFEFVCAGGLLVGIPPKRRGQK